MNKATETIEQHLTRLVAESDQRIDFSDIPTTAAQDWQGANRGKFYRPLKPQLTVRPLTSNISQKL